jgi:parvulin-like peptidyl-prolyl isomerase
MRKLFIKLNIFIVLTLIFWGTAVFAEDAKTRGIAEQILIEMEDSAVTLGEFQKRIDYLSAKGSLDMTDLSAKEQFLDGFIGTRLFARAARLLKINERGDVVTEINDAIDNVLADYYLREHVLNSIRVSEEEIRAYIEKNRETLEKRSSVRTRQVLIKTKKGETPEGLKNARSKADEILIKARAGEDFTKLVDVYSEDKRTKKNGGDMDYVSKGKMGREFDEIIFNMKPGEISPVIKTKSGFGIFKVEDLKPSGKLPLADIRPMIISILKNSKEAAAVESMTKELSARYKVRTNKDLLK